MPETPETPEDAIDVESDEAQPMSGSKAQKFATDPRLISAARALRKALPGDSSFGDDPLSTAGAKQSQQLGRRLSEATAEKPSILREAGLSALQAWDALGSGAGRIPVKADLTILFTDLVVPGAHCGAPRRR